ncbi:MAG: Protein serine/threonine phosphatase PrpC, regulation of stationary phase, partial [uncultured Rubrobacteraceae bacterium]
CCCSNTTALQIRARSARTTRTPSSSARAVMKPSSLSPTASAASRPGRSRVPSRLM